MSYESWVDEWKRGETEGTEEDPRESGLITCLWDDVDRYTPLAYTITGLTSIEESVSYSDETRIVRRTGSERGRRRRDFAGRCCAIPLLRDRGWRCPAHRPAAGICPR